MYFKREINIICVKKIVKLCAESRASKEGKKSAKSIGAHKLFWNFLRFIKKKKKKKKQEERKVTNEWFKK